MRAASPLIAALPMPLEPDDAQHLRAAQSYVERGLYLEANAELEEIDFDVRHLPEILTVRLDIYQALEKWDLMEVVARRLVRYDPNDVRPTILLATATRHTDGLAAAQVILTDAIERIPDAAALHYKLGRLRGAAGRSRRSEGSAQEGDFSGACALSRSALDDPDLRPVWDSLSQ